VALALEKLLFDASMNCVVLDGQTLRMGISRDLGFSAEERSENLRRAAEIAKLINDAGQVCLAAFVAPSAWVREKARELIGSERFFHVHLATPVDVCRQRDKTGQYLAADRGEIVNFPGVTSEYELPDNAELVLDTHSLSASVAAERIWQAIQVRLL
jgi:bifunctional enzyme CysN/CysC